MMTSTRPAGRQGVRNLQGENLQLRWARSPLHGGKWGWRDLAPQTHLDILCLLEMQVQVLMKVELAEPTSTL